MQYDEIYQNFTAELVWWFVLHLCMLRECECDGMWVVHVVQALCLAKLT